MNDWVGRIFMLILIAVVVGVPFAMRPSGDDGPSDTTEKLIIRSPHGEQLRTEFTDGFNRYRKAQGKSPIFIDWRSSGGTSDLRKQTIAEFEAEAFRAIETNSELGGVGIDLFFGGGDYEHSQLAKPRSVERPDGTKFEYTISTPVDISDEHLKEIFPQPDIAGAPLYNPEKRWFGTALSSFGIVFNNDVLQSRGLPKPQTWADLASPVFRNEIALADPGHSGSITQTYNGILRRVGWDEGWRLLRSAFANARYFTASSSKVPVDVSSGEAAAGMCIDFYGRYQAEKVGGDRVGYVDPPRMTTINADPISIMHGAPHQALANEFVLWTLSKEGQRLLQRKVGIEGGPKQFEIRRVPIRRDIYTPEEMKHWTDPIDPFTELAQPFAPGMADFYSTVATISHAMAIDIHQDLVAAWHAIHELEDGEKKEALLEQFHKMPPSLTIVWPDDLKDDWFAALDDTSHAKHESAKTVLKDFVSGIKKDWRKGDHRDLDRLRWTAFFRANYRDVVAKAQD